MMVATGKQETKRRGLSFSLGMAGTLMTLTGALVFVAGCPIVPPAVTGCTDNDGCTSDAAPFCLIAEGATTGTCVACLTDANCDDGTFCNGAETCSDANACVNGDAPCTADNETCNEDTDSCDTTCATNDDCADPTPVCDTTGGVCVECGDDTDCADDLFCNGDETCVSGACVDGTSPCTADQTCDDETDTCNDVVEGFTASVTCPDSVSEGATADLSASTTGETGDVTFAWDISSGNGTFDDATSATPMLTNTAIGTMEVSVTATDTCVGCDDNGTPDDTTDDLDTTDTSTASCSIAVVPETLTVELGPDRIFTNDSGGAGDPFDFTIAIFSDNNDGGADPNEFPEDINCVAADTGGADVEVRTEWTVVSVPPGMSTSNVVLLAPLNTTDLRARINPNSTATMKTLRANGTEATSAQGRVVPGVYTFGCNATTDTDPIGVSDTINITIGDPFAAAPDGTNDVAAVTPSTGKVTHQTTVTDSTTIGFAVKSIIAGTIQWLLDDQDKDDTFDVLLNTTTVAGDGNDGDATTADVSVTSTSRGSYDLEARFTDATGTGDADTAKAPTAIDIHVTTPFSGNVVDMQGSTSTIAGFGLVNSNTAGARVHGARKFAELATTTTAATTVGGTTATLASVTGLGVDSLLIFDEDGTGTGPAYHRVTAISGSTVTVTPAFTAIHPNGADVDTPGALYDGTAVTCCDINNDGFNELITANGNTATVFSSINTNVAATDNSDSPVDNSVWHRGALVGAGQTTAAQVDPTGIGTNDPILDRWTITDGTTAADTITDIVCCDLNNDGWNDLAFGDPLYDETNTSISGRVLLYYNEGTTAVNAFELNPFNTSGTLVSPGAAVAALAADAWWTRGDSGADDYPKLFGYSLCCGNVNADTNSIDDLVIGAPLDGTTAISNGGALADPVVDAARAVGATNISVDDAAGALSTLTSFTPGTLFIADRGAGLEYYKVVSTTAAGGDNSFGQIDVTPLVYTAIADNDTLAIVDAGDLTGLVYVIAGLDNSKFTGGTVISNTGGNATARILAPAAEPGDVFGVDVACGDFTGDGTTDIIIGAPGTTNNASPGLVNAGAVWVVNGGTGVSGASVNPNTRYEGQSAYLGLGHSVAVADMNMNGTADIVAGAINGSVAQTLAASAGRIYIIPNGTSQILGTSTAGTLDALPKISGAAAGSYLGYAMTIGDFGADGNMNLFATAPAASAGNQLAMMFSATATLPSTLVADVTFDNTDTSSPASMFTLPGVLTGDFGGDDDILAAIPAASVADGTNGCVICDIDGDSAGDLFWQGSNGSVIGEAFLILGWVDDTP